MSVRYEYRVKDVGVDPYLNAKDFAYVLNEGEEAAFGYELVSCVVVDTSDPIFSSRKIYRTVWRRRVDE